MDRVPQPVLESRAGRAAYLAPIVLVGGAVALLVGWIIMRAVGVDPDALGVWSVVALIGGLFGVALAAVLTWGARRSRVVITEDELTVTGILAKPRTVRISALSSVGMRSAGNARILELADGSGGSADVGLGVWQRETEILRRIALAARLSGATVDPEAGRALGLGTIAP
jgi:hypothetical protein